MKGASIGNSVVDDTVSSNKFIVEDERNSFFYVQKMVYSEQKKQ